MLLLQNSSLILGLRTLLNVHKVFICQDWDGDDGTIAEGFSICKDFSSAGTQAAYLKSQPGLDDDLSKSLLLCDPDMNSHFGDGVHWLVDEGQTDLMDVLPLRLDSDVITASNTNGTTVEMKEWYRVKSGPLLTSPLGSWGSEKGLSVPLAFKWKRRTDLGGARMKDGLLDFPPVGDYRLNEEDGTVSSYGIIPEVLSTLASNLNFSVRAVLPREPYYSKKTEDGTFVGLVGDLHDGVVDFSTAGVTVSPERQEAVDFSVGVVLDLATLVVRNPATFRRSGTDINVTAYLSIFPGPVWMLVLGLLPTVGLCFLLMELNDPDDARRSRLRSFGRGLVYYFATLVDRSPYDVMPSRGLMSERVLLLALSFVVLILHSHFAGDLTAMMTAGEPQVKMRSFQDAIDQEYEVYTGEGFASGTAMRTAPEGSAMSRVNHKVIKAGTWDEFKHRIRTSEERLAYFVTYLLFVVDDDFSYVLDFEEALPSHLAIGLGKDSELKSMVDYHLIGTMQSGLLAQLTHKWLMRRRPQDNSGRIFVDEANPLGFDNLFFPALVLLCGSAAAFLVMGIERFGQVKTQHRQLADTNLYT